MRGSHATRDKVSWQKSMIAMPGILIVLGMREMKVRDVSVESRLQ